MAPERRLLENWPIAREFGLSCVREGAQRALGY